jgi:hypothetical protein
MKGNSTDLINDGARVEKIQMSASDKLLSSDVSVESEGASSLRAATESSTAEYESTDKAPAEGDVINSLQTIEGIPNDGRSELIFPLVQTAESLDVDTENNLHKEGREESTARNGVQVDCKGDSVMPGHICEGLSLFENMGESGKSRMIPQQFEMPEIMPEEYPEISGGTELVSSELQKVKSSPLEVSAALSELAMAHPEEALTRREAVEDVSFEIAEWVSTGPADVKPETSEDMTSSFQDNMKDATVETVSHGQSGLEGRVGNIDTAHEQDVGTEESVQKADVSLDTGEELGKCGERCELAGSDTLELGINNLSEVTVVDNRNFGIVDSLVCSQDGEHSNSSNFDLENISEVPNEHVKGTLITDIWKCGVHAEGSDPGSFETQGNVAENLEEEVDGVERGENLFVELCHEENVAIPVEVVDKTEHSVCVLANTNSVSSFQATEQSASEFTEGPGTCGENKTFVTGRSFGDVATDCNTTDKDNGTLECTGLNNSETPVSELNEGNSKHLMDNPALDVVGDMFHGYAQLDGSSADGKYCLGVDTVQDHTSPSETAFVQPSAMASEDKVNILGLLPALGTTHPPIQWVAGAKLAKV